VHRRCLLRHTYDHIGRYPVTAAGHAEIPGYTCKPANDRTRRSGHESSTQSHSNFGLAEKVAGCLAGARYLDWPPYVTARATALGVDATPTVLVEGAAVRPDTRTITAAVAAAHRAQ
jgi:hypothetical protein